MNKFILLFFSIVSLTVFSARGAIVINEVYGGGGDTGAPFNQDFVELFNNGAAAVDVSGFSLYYRVDDSPLFVIGTLPGGTAIQPGSHFLVSTGPVGATGAALPVADFAGSATANLSATGGTVEFAISIATILDLVGYGATATHFEGAPAPAPGNTMSISRTGGIDTNNNSLDFTTGAPTPIAAVPEPASYVLICCGILICARQLRRKG